MEAGRKLGPLLILLAPSQPPKPAHSLYNFFPHQTPTTSLTTTQQSLLHADVASFSSSLTHLSTAITCLLHVFAAGTRPQHISPHSRQQTSTSTSSKMRFTTSLGAIALFAVAAAAQDTGGE